MSVDQGKEVSLNEYLGRMRSQIVLAHSQAEEISLKAFDEVARKYLTLLQKVQDTKDKEISDKEKELGDKEKELVNRVKTNLPNNKLSSTTGTVKETPKKK